MGTHQIRNTALAITRRQRFAKIALELAGEATHDVTHQLCALVVSKNRVLSVGYNQPKTHPISSETQMQQLHAEMDAIVRCPYTPVSNPAREKPPLSGAEVIVARVRPSGKPGLAKPCEVCERLLARLGIRRVFYTINSNYDYVIVDRRGWFRRS
jgi:deoxycytidylate deaminase